MSTNNKSEPSIGPVWIALGCGVLTLLLLLFWAGFGFWTALIVGAVVAVFVYLLLSMLGGSEQESTGFDSLVSSRHGEGALKGASIAETRSEDSMGDTRDRVTNGALGENAVENTTGALGDATETANSDVGSVLQIRSVTLAGEEELAARKGVWVYDGRDGAVSDDMKHSSDETDNAALDADDQPTESQPEVFDAAPTNADDLKKIKGVGPGLEKTLNELGIYTFAQIATWGAAEIAWVDARLKFKGRITRDDWIGQSQAFAEREDA